MRKFVLAVLCLAIFGCANSPPQPVRISYGKKTGYDFVGSKNGRHQSESLDGSLLAPGKRLRKGAPEVAATLIEGKEIDKIKAEILEGLKKEIKEEVRRQVRENLSAEIRKTEEARTGKIAGIVSKRLEKKIENRVESEVEKVIPESIRKVELAVAEAEWTKRIKFYGDIRLRYENLRFSDDNGFFLKPANPTELMNTRIDVKHFKYRVRFGVKAHVNDQVDAEIRLATGNESNPVSTNSSINDYLNKDAIVFDMAYVKWRPWEFFDIYGGRMPNLWYSTDLVWDGDLRFEGLTLILKAPVRKSWKSFATAGIFPLQRHDLSGESKWLAAGQLGVERKSRKGLGVKLGAAYYEYHNVRGVKNSSLNPGETDWTAPQFQQKGNTLVDISSNPAVNKMALASQFKELVFTGNLNIGFWDPYHVLFEGDYVKNIGFNRSDVALLTGNLSQPEEVEGYKIGVSIGYPKLKGAGQWKAFFHYKYLEADAVLDAFTDSDFHLGGTNAKGWVLGGNYALRRNMWLTIRWLTADEISGPPLAIDVFQSDISVRF